MGFEAGLVEYKQILIEVQAMMDDQEKLIEIMEAQEGEIQGLRGTVSRLTVEKDLLRKSLQECREKLRQQNALNQKLMESLRGSK